VPILEFDASGRASKQAVTAADDARAGVP
jgi:hypothetical protein